MSTDKIRANIIELCSESEYGSWEFWLSNNKTDEDCKNIIQAISELVEEKKIFPVEYKSIIDQSYKEVPLDIARLKSEVESSVRNHKNVDREKFYWFLSTDKGKQEDIRLRRLKPKI